VIVARQRLATLFACGCEVVDRRPNYDSDQPEIKLANVAMPAFAGFDTFDYYPDFFDPYLGVQESLHITQSHGCGSLTDDFQDIYRDISDVLDLVERGHSDYAMWRVAVHFGHWGAHATAALKALFWASSRQFLIGPFL
jgi:hypothetical protein